MKMTLTTNQAALELLRDKDGGWSYNGAIALVEYLEELEYGTGEEMELDVVTIRCDFSEYASLEEWAQGYFSDWREDLKIEEDADEEEVNDAIRDYIQDHGTLIEFDGGIIVSNF